MLSRKGNYFHMQDLSRIHNTGDMKKFTIFFLLIIVLTFNAVCQEKSVIPIKMERNRTHMSVKIGDKVIPDIILDSGFHYDGLMIYNPSYLDSVDLTGAIQVRIGGAGNGEAKTALMIDSASFYLGQIEIKNHPVIMVQSDLYKGFPSNGIIGYSILGHFITEFNYDNNTMTLYNSDNINVDESWTEIPLYFKDNNIPWIDASVVIEEEKPTSCAMYIDYAAGDAIVLLEKPDMKYFLPKETSKTYIGRGLSGDIYGKTGNISKLIIGPYELNNVIASITSDDIRSKQKNADAILGNGLFRRFNVIFDYSNNKLYLKPNTHFDEPFR